MVGSGEGDSPIRLLCAWALGKKYASKLANAPSVELPKKYLQDIRFCYNI